MQNSNTNWKKKWHRKSLAGFVFSPFQVKPLPCKWRAFWPRLEGEAAGNWTFTYQRVPLHPKRKIQTFRLELFQANPTCFHTAICCQFSLTLVFKAEVNSCPPLSSPKIHRPCSKFPSLLTDTNRWTPKGRRWERAVTLILPSRSFF